MRVLTLVSSGSRGVAKLIVQLAIRSLFVSRIKTLIVGGILFFGSFSLVVGVSLIGSIQRAMSGSVIGSVAGHIQVYSAESRDELKVLGDFSLESPDIEPLQDFARVKALLLSVAHVKAVVPMGLDTTIVSSGNTIDGALDQLRDLIRIIQGGDASSTTRARYQAEKARARHIIDVLGGDTAGSAGMAFNQQEAADLRRARGDAFWDGFDAAPLAALEFLERSVAAQVTDADMVFVHYLGTDPDAFRRAFDRFRLVDGVLIPRGQRGFMFSKYVYEDQLKLKTARRLDKIRDARLLRGSAIARDAELRRYVRENVAQVGEILVQLDAVASASVAQQLRRYLGSADPDLARLLARFFAMDDTTFADRYDFFYRALAPRLNLYRIRVGDTLTVKTLTRSGYIRAISLPLFGTFTLDGLEKSPLAGDYNLMDLTSFRELYGSVTDEDRAEIAELKASVGARKVDRSHAEEELFGRKPEPEAAAPQAGAGDQGGLAAGDNHEATPLVRRRAARGYDPRELERGLVLNVAVILDDPRRVDATIGAIEAAAAKAGLPLKAISWTKAAGFIGQVIDSMRWILLFSVSICCAVALVIINNAIVMATLQRVTEIGTLRSLGAQRRFVLVMIVAEAMIVGVTFGVPGAGLGALVVLLAGHVGIGAFNDVWTFFFSGPRLYPTLAASTVALGVGVAVVVNALSSLSPAWLATRVTPRQAMDSKW